MDNAFFEELAAMNSELIPASARLDEIAPADGRIAFVSHDDTATLEAIARFQAAQRRLSALLETVND